MMKSQNATNCVSVDTVKALVVPRHVGRDDGSDDAAIPGADAVALPPGHRQDRRDAPGSADRAGGRRVLLRVDRVRYGRFCAGRRAGQGRDATAGAGARRSDRGRCGRPDRRRAPVQRKSRMSSNSSNDSREEYVRLQFLSPCKFSTQFCRPALRDITGSGGGRTAAVSESPTMRYLFFAICYSSSEEMRVFDSPALPVPEVQLFSNGRYHLIVSNAGGGYSRWRDLAVTRWREDATRDCWGTFIYLRDIASGEFWSAAYQPAVQSAEDNEAIFTQSKAEFRQRRSDLEIHTEICVSPEDDVEVRRVTLTNHSHAERSIELTSYAELVLAPPGADLAHPVFSNLFVQREVLREHAAILSTRRPRSETEERPWL